MPAIEIQVPDIGDFSEVSVIEVLVKPGDAVKAEQSLITVESDKASMEIPSPQEGVIKTLTVKQGGWFGIEFRLGDAVLARNRFLIGKVAPRGRPPAPEPAT